MSKLYVYGVSEHCSREVLESAFESCGKVDDVCNTGKGYAFVTMADKAGADKAIAELNGCTIIEESPRGLKGVQLTCGW